MKKGMENGTMKNLAKILVYRFGDRLVWKLLKQLNLKYNK